MKLIFRKSRNFKFTSNYTYNLFLKYLSIKKFLFSKGKIFYNNIKILNKKIGSKVIAKSTLIKIFYNRAELIPFRLLKLFFFLLNFKNFFVLSKLPYIIVNKLGVYNGKEVKFINVQRGVLKRLIRCNFRFGSFIFTRRFFSHRRNKRKKKKKKKK